MSIAGELARFLVRTKVGDLPPIALERARMVIASTIASAAMGADIVSSRIIQVASHGVRSHAVTVRQAVHTFDVSLLDPFEFCSAGVSGRAARHRP
jgi:hypothetical protein